MEDRRCTMEDHFQERASVDEKNGLTRRGFLKKGAAVSAASIACVSGIADTAWAKSGFYATLIDLTRCDGCRNEPLPKCVEACRTTNQKKFPEPKEPIKDLWPQKTYDDWSKKRDVTDTLTPYNWTTVSLCLPGRDRVDPRWDGDGEGDQKCARGLLTSSTDHLDDIDPYLCDDLLSSGGDGPFRRPDL